MTSIDLLVRKLDFNGVKSSFDHEKYSKSTTVKLDDISKPIDDYDELSNFHNLEIRKIFPEESKKFDDDCKLYLLPNDEGKKYILNIYTIKNWSMSDDFYEIMEELTFVYGPDRFNLLLAIKKIYPNLIDIVSTDHFNEEFI